MGCCDATSVTNFGHFVAGVPLYYNGNGDGSQLGTLHDLQCDPAFRTRLDNWLADFDQWTGIDRPQKISYAGAGGCRNDGCSSNHNFGTAFDLTRMEWTGSRSRVWYNLNYPNDKKFTMGVEAMCHRHFKDSLGYLWNDDHHSHIHIDNEQAVDFYGDTNSVSQNRFVSGSLRDVWAYTDQVISDTWTTQMSTRVNSVMTYFYGPGHNITASATDWKNYGGVTALAAIPG